MAEADLWAAVFALALKDACDTDRFANPQAGNTAAPSARDAKEAWDFLTAGGEWGAHRDWLAGMNGINKGIVRQEAIRRGPSRAVRVVLMTGEMKAAERVKAQQEPKPRKPRAPFQFKPRGPGKVKPERLALCKAVAEAWASGVPADEIERRHGVSENRAKKMAHAQGARRPDWWAAMSAAKANDVRRASKADRDAEILRRHLAGESRNKIVTEMGIPRSTVGLIVSRLAGSAVEVRGGNNSRAAGGGDAPFHGQNMQEAGR